MSVVLVFGAALAGLCLSFISACLLIQIVKKFIPESLYIQSIVFGILFAITTVSSGCLLGFALNALLGVITISFWPVFSIFMIAFGIFIYSSIPIAEDLVDSSS